MIKTKGKAARVVKQQCAINSLNHGYLAAMNESIIWKAFEGICGTLVMSASAEARSAFWSSPKMWLIAEVIIPSQSFFMKAFQKVVGMSLHRADIMEHNSFTASYATDPKVFLLAGITATSSKVVCAPSLDWIGRV